MADFKLTWFYGQAQFGWSESWWKTASNVNALASPIEAATNYRASMLSQRVSLLGLRVSCVKKERTGRVYLPGSSVAIQEGGTVISLPTNGALVDRVQVSDKLTFDQIRACLRYELLSGAQRLSYRYLDGIPDQVSLTESGVVDFSRPPDWWISFKAWSAYMSANFTIHTTRDYTEGESRPIIEWVTKDPAGGPIGAVLDVTTPLAVKKGDKVVVSAVRMRNGAIRSTNGTWTVDSITVQTGVSSTIFLRDSETRDITQIKALGKIRTVKDLLMPFDKITPYSVGTHKRGGPFGQLRGRLRTRNYVT
jgi:hypothetical protein